MSLTYDGEDISLAPSIGNWALPCQSHYWIHRGKARWSRRYSAGEIIRNRARDHHELKAREENQGLVNETGTGLLTRLAHRWRIRRR